MFYPQRQKCKQENVDQKIKIKLEERDFKEIEKFKKFFLEKYIQNNDFKDAIEKISLTQLNYFQERIEEVNFSLESKILSQFVSSQIERAQKTEKKSLLDALPFYEYFQNKILGKTWQEESQLGQKEKTFYAFDMIKKYKRYFIGDNLLKKDQHIKTSEEE